MSKKVLAAALGCILLSASFLPSGAMSLAGALPSKYVAPNAYQHVWQAKSLFAGDAGQFDQRVIDNTFEFRRDGEEFAGVLNYHDVVAIVDATGAVFSQEALIEIALEGSSLSPERAGGTFTGTATLTGRRATSLADALGPPARVGEIATYEVTGHWGAQVDADTARGEILYETAVPVGEVDTVRSVGWFNRSSLENPDGLGEAHTFDTIIAEADIHSIDGEDDADLIPESESDSEENASTGRSSAGVRLSNVFAFIKKGMAGDRNESLGQVSSESLIAARALRDARPVGATALPANSVSIDIDMSGQYLDTKNRVAGLLGAKGPEFEGGNDLAEAAAEMRANGPGIPALPPDVDAGRFWAQLALQTVRSGQDLAGAKALIADLELVGPGLDSAAVLAVRSAAMTVLAVTSAPFGDGMLDGAGSCAVLVGETELKEGALTDAVLAAARDERAPDRATIVTEFVREESLDVDRENPDPETLPGGMLGAWDGPGIDFMLDGRTVNLDPERWLAYRRADGTMYWLPGEGSDFALTDGALLGWAYSSWRGALVDSDDVGVVSGYATAPARY